MDVINLDQYLFPLTQVEIDRANYKGGVKRHPKQKPRYNVYAGISVDGAKHLYSIAKEAGVKNLSVSVNGKTLNVTGLNTVRFENLVTHTHCVTCDRSLSYLRLEDNGSEPHINGYSHDHVMMTRDHIVPRSAGGPDVMDNIQMMCSHCNKAKGSLPMEEFIKRKFKNPDDVFVPEEAIVLKRGNITVTQEATMEFIECPGLVAEFKMVADNTSALHRNPKISHLSFKKDGIELGFLPEPYDKDKVYDYTHVRYLHQYGSIEDLKGLRKFSAFDRLVLVGDSVLLDGSLVKMTEY